MFAKAAIVVIALAGCMVPFIATAQPADDCAACVGASGCDTKRDACIAECRARIFSIDPKRTDCIADCSSKAQQCMQTASSSCRARNLCR